MKNGHWIPISKGFLKALPHDREYTELEAAYSLQIDYDCKNEITVAGYSDLWRWSRGKVYRFLERMNVEIKYPAIKVFLEWLPEPERWEPSIEELCS